MILILDNGGHYSDHEIVFVDCQDWDPDEVVFLYQAKHNCNEAKEIGRATAVSWRDPKAFTTVEKFFRYPDAAVKVVDLTTLSDRMIALLRTNTWDDQARMLLNLEIERRQQL